MGRGDVDDSAELVLFHWFYHSLGEKKSGRQINAKYIRPFLFRKVFYGRDMLNATVIDENICQEKIRFPEKNVRDRPILLNWPNASSTIVCN